MADDLAEVEDLARDHQGFENDEIGRILIRLIRELRQTRQAVKNLRDRIDVLETTTP